MRGQFGREISKFGYFYNLKICNTKESEQNYKSCKKLTFAMES